MEIAKCHNCGKTEQLEVAKQTGWVLNTKFDESIYGEWGNCPKCMEPKKTARNLEEFIDVWGKEDAKYTTVTFGRYYNSTVDKVPQTYFDWAVRTLTEKNGNRTKTNPQRETIPDPIRTSSKKETSPRPQESTHIDSNKPGDFSGFLLLYEKMLLEKKKKEEQEE
jgi:hypothetical protein